MTMMIMMMCTNFNILNLLIKILFQPAPSGNTWTTVQTKGPPGGHRTSMTHRGNPAMLSSATEMVMKRPPSALAPILAISIGPPIFENHSTFKVRFYFRWRRHCNCVYLNLIWPCTSPSNKFSCSLSLHRVPNST